MPELIGLQIAQLFRIAFLGALRIVELEIRMARKTRERRLQQQPMD